jgi:hypothetical protein
MKYRIIWSLTIAGLEASVKVSIAEGWKPIGGVAVCYILHAAASLNFYQAMTQEEEK